MAEHPSGPAIEVDGVSKRFGSVTALDRVSFEVAAGELFFLLGPSGCGKTTLLRILAGLERPDSGTIRLAGRDVASLPSHERGCPMVFQNYALWPHLSVTENVAFGLVERRVARAEIQARVRGALGRVGLGDLGGRMPGQLSGGQQQRVVLARALVLDPPVVLLDEPLSNLDAKLRLEMREEIERLHAETRITFVYVTHDQAEALSLADRMAVMNAGRLCALGTPRDLYHRPPNLFCADFLGEANAVDGRIVAARAGALEVETPLGPWLAAPPPGPALAPGAAARCVIRPENVRLGAGQGNGFEATVDRLRMNGSTTTVFLNTRGVQLKATVLSQIASGLAPGSKAEWHAPAEDTLAFAAQPEGAPA